MMRDADFGVVRLRAFGAYAIRVTDPGKFIKEIVGTDGLFETAEISNYLRDMLLQAFATALGSAKIAALDLAANYREIGDKLSSAINQDFGQHGLALTRFLISNISVPQEVEAALDKRSEMGAVGDLGRFTQFQVASAIPDAAKQPGALAGIGMGLGAGMVMGGQMAGAVGQGMAGAQAGSDDAMSKLAQLKKMLDAGLIEKAEYDAKKKELLAKM
jgi:membrane protease subunit (stomatin/prohibitin family)